MSLFSLPQCRMVGNLKVTCGKGFGIARQEIVYFHGKMWEKGVKMVNIRLTIQATNGNSQLFHGSRLTFQLASPVASERFDLLAKTNFSLARQTFVTVM